jgi:AAA15 family ATPase/GTPase
VRLISFSVSNYRSITGAHSVALCDLTVLIGKNNEGKSNILRALDAAMSLLRRHSNKDRGLRKHYFPHAFEYRWKRDFPIQLQNRGSRQSTFRLEFSLTPEEIAEFKSQMGSI